MLDEIRAWARRIKSDVLALFLASRDPRVPWLPKVFAVVVAGYALSPIDLIPDFIPVLGYLDDLILVPLGIVLVVKLIPADLMAEHRLSAANLLDRPASRVAGIFIICLWVLAVALSAWGLYDLAPDYFPL